ncbi:Bol2p Ecym_1198 [Eremothecium cymbalariae DBVPG|uniref:Bola-like protein n=1 Tax=Eremothecium cymbalariae (strain CBS 270.75 / DBVPG 7215 / KCTC 17166 / NRRL Y-17582) TaxID=931890 RepID=G8JMY2_ERECY|nr:hypothetical protein Ecym_1198 [Eremothecium cymbalariae DBVPG\
MVSEQDLSNKLAEEIPELYQTIVTDASAGCGQSYDVVVVSDVFKGKSKLQRCRMVNKLLAAEIAQLHAFGLKCYTVQEFSEFTL